MGALGAGGEEAAGVVPADESGAGLQEDAERVLDWYGLRWRIEDWHQGLKAGCKVEYLGHRTRERIERAVTIKAVIAWRLAVMTLLGRETPELPAEVFHTQLQMRVLRHFAQRRGMNEPANLGFWPCGRWRSWEATCIAGTARLRGIRRSGRAGRV